jgi:hypothetical protein
MVSAQVVSDASVVVQRRQLGWTRSKPQTSANSDAGRAQEAGPGVPLALDVTGKVSYCSVSIMQLGILVKPLTKGWNAPVTRGAGLVATEIRQ